MVGDPKIVEEIQREKAPAGSKADWRTYRPVVDSERCTGCRMCWVYCPEHCIDVLDGRSVIDYAFCKGCGICIEECPVDAIEMISESERS
ncbi:MAG TPA: 4Fe-4S binding protein [Patescibacteria group bacterium]|nr:4Fe-4S binding protein [Patescibacteria group bacterium]